MNVRGLLTTSPQKRLYVYTENLMANPVNIPNFMIVTSMSIMPRRTIHEKDDKPHRLEGNSPIPRQNDRGNSNSISNAA